MGWLWVLLVALGGLVMAAEGFGREAAEHPSPKRARTGVCSALQALPPVPPLWLVSIDLGQFRL